MGKDDLLVDAQELHVLKDRPVKFELRTIDVFIIFMFRNLEVKWIWYQVL